MPSVPSFLWPGNKRASPSFESSGSHRAVQPPPKWTKSRVHETMLLTTARKPSSPPVHVGEVWQAGGEFELTFRILLHEIVRHDTCLMTVVPGQASRPLLLIGVRAFAKTLFVQFAAEEAGMLDIKAPATGLRRSRIVEFSFSLSNTAMGWNAQVRVGAEVVTTEELAIDVPMMASLNVFLGSDKSLLIQPASASIEDVVFRARSTAHKDEDISWAVAFDMPPLERQLLEEAEQAIKALRVYGKFDFFFGCMIALNSLTLGLQIQFGSWPYWEWINIFFVALFAFELAVRLYWLGPLWYVKWVRDRWLLFDVFVVGFSFFDTVKFISLPFSPRIVRQFRMLKLARMVRLLRSFRVLGLLIEGTVRSAGLLVWICALVLCMAYTFALIIVGLSNGQEEDDLAAFKEAMPEWTQMRTAILAVIQMVCFDDWTAPIRSASNLGTLLGWGVSILMLAFIAFAGLGLLNMMVGVMSNIAFLLDAKNRRALGAENMKMKEEALKAFRQKLKEYGERPLFQSDRYISPDELLQALTTDPDMKALLDVLEVKVHEVLEMDVMFVQNGDIEIDGLMAAIGTVLLQRYFGSIGSELAANSVASRLRPNDMLFLKAGMTELDKQVSAIDNEVASLCVLLYDLIQSLHLRADQAFTLLRAFNDRWSVPRDWGRQDVGKNTRSFSRVGMAPSKAVSTTDLVEHMDNALVDQAEAKLYSTFDIFFGVVLVANAVITGAEVSGAREHAPNSDFVFVVLDFGFLCLYCCEFVFRAILFADLVEGDIESSRAWQFDVTKSRAAAARLHAIRKRMCFGIIPPCPPHGFRAVLACMPSFLKDKLVLFDAGIILFCAVDIMVLFPLRRAGFFTENVGSLSVVRIVRLVRLTRILRMFRLFPQLQFLIRVFLDSLNSIFVVMIILVASIYVFAIMTFVSFEGTSDPELQSNFGSLPAAAISGWQIVTFDNWRSILESSAKYSPMATAFMGVVSMFLGLGLLKLTTGLVAGSSISLVRKQREELRLAQLHEFLEAMDQLERLVIERFASELVPQELFEAVLGLRFLPRRRPSHDEMAARRARKLGNDPEFAQRFHSLLKRAQLTPPIAKLVFEQIDCLGDGHVSIHMFTRGAAVFREDLSKVDVFASTVILHYIKDKQTDVSSKLVVCQETLDTMIKDVSMLIHRKHCTNEEDIASREDTPELGCLTSGAEEAFAELVDSQSTPGAKQVMGPVHMVIQDGVVRIQGEFCEGKGVDFRDHVNKHDFIVVQRGQADEEKTVVVVVRNVVSATRLRISRSPVDLGHEYFPYCVGKTCEDPRSKNRHTKCRISKQLHQDTSLSPRSAHKMFEWEMSTKHQDRRQLRTLMAERDRLLALVVRLEEQKEHLRDRSLLFDAYRFWCAVVEHSQGRPFRSNRRGTSRRSPRYEEMEDQVAAAIPESVTPAIGLAMELSSNSTRADEVEPPGASTEAEDLDSALEVYDSLAPTHVSVGFK